MLLSTNKGRWTTYSINTAYRQGVAENSRSKGQGVEENSRSKTQGVEEVQGVKVATLEGERLQPPEQKVATSFIKKRLTKEDLELEIMRLCKDTKKKEELAALLGKSENYLKDKFIYRMQKEGKIEALYSLIPNHPEQAYRTTELYRKNIH